MSLSYAEELALLQKEEVELQKHINIRRLEKLLDEVEWAELSGDLERMQAAKEKLDVEQELAVQKEVIRKRLLVMKNEM